VKVAKRTVGLWKNGAFQPVATDARGTVMADTNGTPRIASPFGARDVRPDLAAAIDYVEKGWDADLGLVRMGVRDYDPAIDRFTTPDPLYLEKPELCLKSPAQCNLYAYAQDPISATDPSGTDAEAAAIAASNVARAATRDPFSQSQAMDPSGPGPMSRATAAPPPPASEPGTTSPASASPAAPAADASEPSRADQRTAINAAAKTVLLRNQEMIEGKGGVLIPVPGKTLLPHDGSTWCSNYLAQVAKELGIPLPLRNANDTATYLQTNTKDWGSLGTDLARAQKMQQEGYFVVPALSAKGGIGHVQLLADEPATGVKLPAGMVVQGSPGGAWVAQSGRSVGYLNIRWTWKAADLAKVTFYYYKGTVGCSK
jgi:RHS repeat-associated protein